MRAKARFVKRAGLAESRWILERGDVSGTWSSLFIRGGEGHTRFGVEVFGVFVVAGFERSAGLVVSRDMKWWEGRERVEEGDRLTCCLAL